MSWRPALRIARRDAVRARGRSALIVAMVALPVLGLGGLDVLLRSAQLDPDERITRDLGRTQARVSPVGGATTVFQAADPNDGLVVTESDGTTADPRKVVPAGYRILTQQDVTTSVKTASGEALLSLREVDVADPAFTGRFQLRAGRAPREAGEVAVTTRTAERLGTQVGGTATLLSPLRELRIVGVVDASGDRGQQAIWAPPGSVIDRASVEGVALREIFLVGDRPVGWPDVLRLNRMGATVLSRSVILDPPPRAEIPYFTKGLAVDPTQGTLTLALAVAVGVTLAALEVILLAGAAFAVGARRQARSLGLLAATGGDARDIRRVVLSGGVVLGLVGASAGLVLGIAAAATAMPLLERYADADFGRFDLRPLELGAAALVGFVVAVLAAVLPARNASRQDPVAALSGRRGQVRTPKRVPALGLLLVGLGIATAVAGSLYAVSGTVGVNPVAGGTATIAAGLIAGGAALAQLGLIVCSPAIVGVAGRWARGLPLALRLALTDAARHRGRSAPAVAAVLTAVTGATALALVAASFDDRDRRSYQPAWPANAGGASLERFILGSDGEQTLSLANPQRVLAAVAPELPELEPTVLHSTPSCVGDGSETDEQCVYLQPVLPARHECPAWRQPGAVPDVTDWRCDPRRTYSGGALPATPVGGAEVLRSLTGSAPEAATRVLQAGGVVVLDRRYFDGDHITIERSTVDGKAERIRLPAVPLSVPRPPAMALISEQAARRLRIEPEPTHVLLHFRDLPSVEQEDAARAAIRKAGLDVSFSVERGYSSDYGLGLLALVLGAAVITLGAAGIATGLAQADARADHATLAAVGATPGLRRVLAAAQALAVAGLGAVLGLLAGLVPSIAFVGALDSLHLVVPWVTIAQILVGIPVVAAACAWLFTRSRLPLERRVAA